MDKPRRRSDSDADPKLSSLTQRQIATAPANPFSVQSPTSSTNPFQREDSNVRTRVRIARPRLSMTSPRLSVPDKLKLRAEGINRMDHFLGQKIKQQVDCVVRVYREKGWASLQFESEEKATLCLERRLEILGHPDLVLVKYKPKKSLMDRLSKPVSPSPAVQPPKPLPDPRSISANPRELQLFLLEQRDSQLREQQVPGGDTLRGVCEDMCPEKERFWREDRRCLSSFEMVPGGEYRVDHSAAVKEFSRSAADKSQPLPHELRTESALERTVLYLCHKILPHQTRTKDWYTFLSNRLEAVRQDITVQHFCSVRTAKVMETCVRFHGLCAVFLLNPPFDKHDYEMNDMSLRSIITPLLQMYRDLRQEGVICPNESLFVSYSLVLAIHTKKIGQDLLHIPDDVIMSPQVQMVLRIWPAVSMEDFVTFFKLLRKADFLTACLLNRFVARMRNQALNLINKLTNKQTHKQEDVADTQRVTRLLCFDDETECVDICKAVGLTCDVTSIYLNSSKPVQIGVKNMSLRLIISKNISGLGEVVYGGPLPPFSPRPPTMTGTHAEIETENWDSALDSLAETETAESVNSVVSSLLIGVCKEVLIEENRQQLIGQLSEQLCAQLIWEETCVCVRQELEREVAERWRRIERQKFVDNVSESLFVSLQQGLMLDLVRTELEREREHRALLARVVSDLTNKVYSELETEVVRALVLTEADTGVKEAKKRRKARLEEQRTRVVRMRLRNAWGLWRDAILVRQKKKEVVRKFQKVTPDWSGNKWRLSMDRGYVSPGERERESSWLRRESELAQLDSARIRTPINIPALLGDTLMSRSVSDWMLAVLVADKSADWPLKLLTSHSTTETACVRVRVREVSGESANEMKGCSAVLIIAGDVTQECLGIHKFSAVRTCPLVPLCLLHTQGTPASLSHTPPCIGAVRGTVVSKVLTGEGRKELERSLKWLAERSETTPKLHCQRLSEYVADRMYSLCFKPAAVHAAERERIGIRGPALESFLGLYSAALEGVREELTGWRVREVNWPARGDYLWDWNEDHQLSDTCSCLEQLIAQPRREEQFLEECRALSAECDSILTTNNLRQKRLGLPLSTPWGEILESLLNAQMQSPRFDKVVCSPGKSEIELPSEWTAALDDVMNRTVCLAPVLRRKMNQSSQDLKRKRKRSTDVVQPIREAQPARKAARLSLERSLLHLEGLVTEEITQTEYVTTMLQCQSDVTWEDQLVWVENEIKSLTNIV